jgi:hypothetical protein
MRDMLSKSLKTKKGSGGKTRSFTLIGGQPIDEKKPDGLEHQASLTRREAG